MVFQQKKGLWTTGDFDPMDSTPVAMLDAPVLATGSLAGGLTLANTPILGVEVVNLHEIFTSKRSVITLSYSDFLCDMPRKPSASEKTIRSLAEIADWVAKRAIARFFMVIGGLLGVAAIALVAALVSFDSLVTFSANILASLVMMVASVLLLAPPALAGYITWLVAPRRAKNGGVFSFRWDERDGFNDVWGLRGVISFEESIKASKDALNALAVKRGKTLASLVVFAITSLGFGWLYSHFAAEWCADANWGFLNGSFVNIGVMGAILGFLTAVAAALYASVLRMNGATTDAEAITLVATKHRVALRSITTRKMSLSTTIKRAFTVSTESES